MKKLYLLSLIFFTAISYAEIKTVSDVPATWKLENYAGGNVVVWYSGATCENGLLQFQDIATSDDKNRFWSTILAAKVSNRPMFVTYDDSDACKIHSFGLHD
jgi:hypothetical protein